VSKGANPRDIKMLLADEIVSRFHNSKAAFAAREEFINRFRHGNLPDYLPESVLACDESLWIAKAIKQAGLTGSTSEAIKMLESGAVRIDGVKVTDKETQLQTGSTYVIAVGKRKFAKVTLRSTN
jgi:tyrosyl-tRNA synthetase